MYVIAGANILNGLDGQRIETLQFLLQDFEIQCLLKIRQKIFYSEYKVIHIHCRKIWKV